MAIPIPNPMSLQCALVHALIDILVIGPNLSPAHTRVDIPTTRPKLNLAGILVISPMPNPIPFRALVNVPTTRPELNLTGVLVISPAPNPIPFRALMDVPATLAP
jgi:hypothetical protein